MDGDADDATRDRTSEAADGDTSTSTAAADDDGGRDDGVIHFHFPIDIQIVGGVDSGVVDAVVARVFDELRRELERSA